jgi:restriction system protein
MLDALRELGGSGKPREVSELIAERCNVNDKKLEETLKSGQTRFYNQVHWARQYLVWDGLLDGTKRGVWTLTPGGYETKLSEADSRKLFLKWVKIHAEARKSAEESTPTPDAEPDEETEDHKQVLLEVLRSVTPEGFERICARLLRESGFERVTITGGPKDEGIDGIGILQVNPFVSFKVLFQCKRYKGAVSRAQVGDFRNAMIGRADKGIIITTGTFTADARKEADRDGAPPVELVDGDKLVEMFEGIELGLRPKTIYEVDHAFFAGFLPSET